MYRLHIIYHHLPVFFYFSLSDAHFYGAKTTYGVPRYLQVRLYTTYQGFTTIASVSNCATVVADQLNSTWSVLS